MKYIGPDFCNITTLLTDEELLIQKTANEFVTKEFMPLVNEYYEKGSFPVELIPKLVSWDFLVQHYLKNMAVVKLVALLMV